ncbi:MAG: hypothetical protein KC776_15570 [Myxococcales bacterium]|nr:hypothetical protein [Myxococcales bacterium]MCB9582616.1 hypothetical protein [Polyangiaceae bacterium]
MKAIINKTRRPLRIHLPGGKTLFLGPTRRADIRDDALEHPAVKKLLEAGDIEVTEGGHHGRAASRGGVSPKGGGQGHGGGHTPLTSGDR